MNRTRSKELLRAQQTGLPVSALAIGRPRGEPGEGVLARVQVVDERADIAHGDSYHVADGQSEIKLGDDPRTR